MNLQGHTHIQPHETAWLEGSTHLHALLDLSLHDDILTPIREGLACLKRLAMEQLQPEEKKWGLRTSSNQTWKDKLEWCLNQRALSERAEALEKELSAWSHPNPSLSRPYSEAQLSAPSEWLAQQREEKAKVSELETLAKTLSYRLPYFSIPYEAGLVAEQSEILSKRSSRWSRFDALEKRWADLEYTRTYTISERETLDIEGEEAYCTEQEGLWSDYQSYVQQYKSMGLSAKVYRVPIDKESFLIHKDSGDFIAHWSKEIERHKTILLPRYRNRVSFPTAPFSGEEIEAYVRDVRPYLTRSKRERFWSPIGVMAVGVLGVVAWQYGLHVKAVDLENRAGAMGWNLDIAGPPYDAGEIEENMALLEESEPLYPQVLDLKTRAGTMGWDLDIGGPPYDAGEIRETMVQLELHPQVLDLEKRAGVIGWTLDIAGPPYDGEEVSRYASEVSESELNQVRAETLSQTLGQSIDFPWSTVRLDRLDSLLSAVKTVDVSGGRFIMGCLPRDGECYDNEKPRHEVMISHDMIVMRTEVTQGLYESVMGSNPSSFASCGKDCPVENVSWYDAVAFANALSRKEGLSECYSISGTNVSWFDENCSGWRLPTEAEWEYLAQGVREHLYSGSNRIGDVAWYVANSGSKTHPVGQKSANGFGLYGMSGNVWEWTWDWYDAYSSDSVTDPRGPSSGSHRVNRGGSWNFNTRYARATYRLYNDPSLRNNDLGFRLLRKKI